MVQNFGITTFLMTFNLYGDSGAQPKAATAGLKMCALRPKSQFSNVLKGETFAKIANFSLNCISSVSFPPALVGKTN